MKIIRKILLLLLFAAILTVAAKSVFESLVNRFLPLKYEEYIEKYSEEYGLDMYLVMGVIRAESSFDHEAHSGIARGLMQLTESTAEWICKKQGIEYYEDIVENPEQNISMGCFYLAYLKDCFGDTETALAAYNAGMGNVSGWLADSRYSQDGKTLGKIPFGETERYVRRVKILSELYKKIY